MPWRVAFQRATSLPACVLGPPGGVGHPVSSHYCCTAPSFVGLSSEDHRDPSAQLEEPPRRRGVGYSSSASSGYRQRRRDAPGDREGGSDIAKTAMLPKRHHLASSLA